MPEFEPSARLVITAKSRTAPSSWLDELRIFSGQSGQVSALFSRTGGCGMTSSWVTDAAPWRFEVPTQSEPVSPPPITTTCLSLALSVPLGAARDSSSPALRLFCCVRKSMAKWMPGELAARHRQVARELRAARQGDGVIAFEQRLDRDDGADFDAGAELDALGFHLAHAPVDVALLHLEVGNAVAQQAADAVGLLEQRHRMAGTRELLGAGHAGGARADDGDALAGLLRPAPAARPSPRPSRDR